jgi:hypothetical protein
MKLSVSNQTNFERTEWVRFGAPKKSGHHVFKSVPRSDFCVAKVKVGPHYTGLVDVIEDATDEPFRMSPILHDNLESFEMFLVSGDKEFPLTTANTGTKLHESSRVLSYLWQVVLPQGVFELVTMMFHSQPTITFKAFFAAQSLTNALVDVDLKLRIRHRSKGAVRVVVYELNKHTADELAIYKGQLADTQGLGFTGAIVFGSAAMLADPSLLEAQTAQAQLQRPLTAVYDWPWRGVFQQPSKPLPNGELKKRFDKLEAGRGNWPNLLANLGTIGSLEAGRTGDAAGFGWRHHQELVGPYGALFVQGIDVACDREYCRPGWHFEGNGSFVSAAQHPQWVCWSGTTFGDRNVSPDQLGRTHSSGTAPGGWQGEDWQHRQKGPFIEKVLLTADVMGLRRLTQMHEVWMSELRVILPDSGRGVCRGQTLPLAQSYLATGDKRILVAGLARFTTVLEPEWKKQWAVGDVMKPYTVKTDDGKVGMPGRWLMLWEDALAGVGAKALEIVSREAGLPASVVDRLGAFAKELVVLVAKFGYYQNPTQVFAQMELLEGNTPGKTRGGEENSYNVWCLGAVQLARTHAIATKDTELLDRCEQILAVMGEPEDRWSGVA